MKYTKFAILACSSILASGQGLYNMSNLYALDEETSPLTYTLGLRYGYDDNVTPIGSDCPGMDAEGSSYISADIRAGLSHNESNYNLSIWGSAGVIYYLDAPDNIDEVNPVFSAGLNYGYRFNERVRFNTRNYINYGFEPDYEQGIANDRRSELYFAYRSNNDIGIRWSERLATVHGVSFTGADYGNGGDYSNLSFYNQIRYRVSPRTVLTGNYAYDILENDANRHTYGLGMEHSLTERTGISIQGGYSTLDHDSGRSSSSPYVNASIRHTVNDRFSVSGYASYGIDNNFTTIAVDCNSTTAGQMFGYNTFETRKNLRVGLRGNYAISESFSLFGGVSVVNTKYEDFVSASGTAETNNSVDALIYNLNAGFRYGFTNNMAVVGSYNYSNSSSDEADPFEYTRNRYSLGVEATF